jgi:PAS domain S-box-containing protein
MAPRSSTAALHRSDTGLGSDRVFRYLVESVRDYAIFLLDTTGRVATWNPGAQRIKQYTAEDIIGKHFSIFYPTSDRQSGKPEMELAVAAETGRFEDEGWRLRKDGTRFWANVIIIRVNDEEGNQIGFGKITRDLTDRKQLMDQLNHHGRELELRIAEREQTNAELEAFSYSVSHDLRAPLRAIGGFSEVVKEDYGKKLDETGLGYVNEIIAAAGRMNQLIQDLLDYSRLGRVELKLQPVNVSHTVGKALQQLGEDPAKISIEIGTTGLVLAHEPTLVQVISNLISNALKFHDRNVEREVRIWSSIQPHGKSLRLLVRDNGIGIAEHHHERIFQVFERLHDREAYPGTGIGLAIVKRAIQRMGGTYGLESGVGEGSTFWIELPLYVRE